MDASRRDFLTRGFKLLGLCCFAPALAAKACETAVKTPQLTALQPIIEIGNPLPAYIPPAAQSLASPVKLAEYGKAILYDEAVAAEIGPTIAQLQEVSDLLKMQMEEALMHLTKCRCAFSLCYKIFGVGFIDLLHMVVIWLHQWTKNQKTTSDRCGACPLSAIKSGRINNASGWPTSLVGLTSSESYKSHWINADAIGGATAEGGVL